MFNRNIFKKKEDKEKTKEFICQGECDKIREENERKELERLQAKRREEKIKKSTRRIRWKRKKKKRVAKSDRITRTRRMGVCRRHKRYDRRHEGLW